MQFKTDFKDMLMTLGKLPATSINEQKQIMEKAELADRLTRETELLQR